MTCGPCAPALVLNLQVRPMFRPKRFSSAKMQFNLSKFSAFFAEISRIIRDSWSVISASSPLKFAAVPAFLAIFAALSGPAACANEMSFSIVTIGSSMRCGANCPSFIAADGEITNNTPAAFATFLQHNAPQIPLDRPVVLLDSPGGKVVASMELGKILRRLGAAVVVAKAGGESSNGTLQGGRCFSACVYAFIGGKKRVIPPQSAAGIHRMFTFDYGIDPSGLVGERHQHFDDGGMAAILSRYTGRMGVNPQIIAAAEHVTPEQIHIVSRAEMARWHLATTRF
jgi:hypothetical protein